MTDLKRRPSWELRNMIQALSFHSWLNTKEENARLQLARQELKERVNLGRQVMSLGFREP
jgi:hypothetical protein